MLNIEPNKVTAVLRVVATGEFYDNEASEEILRYCVEQDLEDAGFDVDVSVMSDMQRFEEERFVKAMVDLWVRDDAPQWIRDYVREELKKQRGLKEEKQPEYPCINCCSPSERAACCGCPKERQWQERYGNKK